MQQRRLFQGEVPVSLSDRYHNRNKAPSHSRLLHVHVCYYRPVFIYYSSSRLRLRTTVINDNKKFYGPTAATKPLVVSTMNQHNKYCSAAQPVIKLSFPRLLNVEVTKSVPAENRAYVPSIRTCKARSVCNMSRWHLEAQGVYRKIFAFR